MHGRFVIAGIAFLGIDLAITWPHPSLVFLGWIVLVFAIVVSWHATRPILTFDEDALVVEGMRVPWDRVRSLQLTGDLVVVEMSENGSTRTLRGVRRAALPSAQ